MSVSTGSCCIADLSLAVKNDRNVQSQLRGRPVKIDPRYMAPELLEGQDIESLDFASLRKVDMYSFSLVLWEIARKCLIQGVCSSFNMVSNCTTLKLMSLYTQCLMTLVIVWIYLCFYLSLSLSLTRFS